MRFGAPSIFELGWRPFDLDLSADGSLLAVAQVGQEQGPPVVVLRTKDGSTAGSFGSGYAGRGVVFGSMGELIHMVEERGRQVLYAVNLESGALRTLATYPATFNCKQLVRDAVGQRIAACGTSAEVWDATSTAPIASIPGIPRAAVRVAFLPCSGNVASYGDVAGQIVVRERDARTEVFRMKAPGEAGRQLSTPRSDDLLAAVADAVTGLYIHDAVAGTRLLADRFGDSTASTLVAFSPSGRWLLRFSPIGLTAQDLRAAEFSEMYGPEFQQRMPAAIASADDEPLVALAWDEGQIAWLRVEEED